MKYYLIGIKGTGMSSLATILMDLGYEVIGYDDYKEHKFTEDVLNAKNIPIYYDDSYEFSNEIVVYTPALQKNHKELTRARNKNLKMLQYNEMLGELTKMFKTICVSGCHGKTTTSSMMSHVMNGIIGCNYLIGDSTGFVSKENEYFVIEACEYRRHFLSYDPTFTIVTNIELDHVDYYKDIEDIKDAYLSLINKTKESVVLCGDDKDIRDLNIKNALYYGFDTNNDIVAKNVEIIDDYTCFDVYINNDLYNRFRIKLVGNHMVLNALATIGMAYLLGLNKDDVFRHLETFGGAKRRFSETIINNTIVIDDYAHHPTELRASINAAKNKYPNKKIIAIFMPNTYSRVARFYKEFADALALADKTFVMEIAKGREKEEDYPGVSSELILNKIKDSEKIKLDEEEKLLNYKDEVILFMSCQNIYILKDRLVEKLKEEVNEKDN